MTHHTPTHRLRNKQEPMPAIDWELCVRLANNKPELAKELLKIFVTDLSIAQTGFHQALQDKDIEKLNSLTHRLLGATCYCGVPRLKAVLTAMEILIKLPDITAMTDLLSVFDKEVNDIVTAFNTDRYTDKTS